MNSLTRERRVLMLGTGGTIAGRTTIPGSHVDYVAAQRTATELLAGIRVPSGVVPVAEQVAQIDSKDMSFTVWQRLAWRCAQALADPQVDGIVITHGTDTLEETAFFLDQVLHAHKPVVLTGAMRAADVPEADGPHNLGDALRLAATPQVTGVLSVFAGRIHGAREVRKVHPDRLDAFSSGEDGPLGFMAAEQVRWVREPMVNTQERAEAALQAVARANALPRVEIVTSHAAADGLLLDALVREYAEGHPQAVQGLVLAATGNGTLHHAIEAAALRAQAAGIAVVRATRCNEGRIVAPEGWRLRDAGALSPVKARIALMLALLQR